MANRPTRTAKLRSEEVQRLRTAMGISLETLASRADIDIKTLNRKLSGDPAYHRTIRQIADVLGVPSERLIEGYQPPVQQPTRFELGLQVTGDIGSREQIAGLLAIVNDAVGRISALGVSVATFTAAVTLADLTRIIVCLFGWLDDRSPFWVFVAVAPNKYEAFNETHKKGQIDLHKFEPFGEIIVSGRGESPPDDIIAKVAEMYQTDPNGLKRALEQEREQYLRRDALVQPR